MNKRQCAAVLLIFGFLPAGPAFAQQAVSISTTTVEDNSQPPDRENLKNTSATNLIRALRDRRFTLASVPDSPVRMAAAAFPQETTAPARPAPEGQKKSGMKKWIFVIAAGAAAGVILATQVGSGSDSSAEPNRITVGTPTVGAPQ